jgi:hypothetical protein
MKNIEHDREAKLAAIIATSDPEHPNIRTSEHPNIRTSEHPNIRQVIERRTFVVNSRSDFQRMPDTHLRPSQPLSR